MNNLTSLRTAPLCTHFSTIKSNGVDAQITLADIRCTFDTVHQTSFYTKHTNCQSLLSLYKTERGLNSGKYACQ